MGRQRQKMDGDGRKRTHTHTHRLTYPFKESVRPFELLDVLLLLLEAVCEEQLVGAVDRGENHEVSDVTPQALVFLRSETSVIQTNA